MKVTVWRCFLFLLLLLLFLDFVDGDDTSATNFETNPVINAILFRTMKESVVHIVCVNHMSLLILMGNNLATHMKKVWISFCVNSNDTDDDEFVEVLLSEELQEDKTREATASTKNLTRSKEFLVVDVAVEEE